jgi:hypothetical protein
MSIEQTYPLHDRHSWERYVPQQGRPTELGITSPAWQEYDLANPSGVRRERSMLLMNELAVLFMLAKDHYTGAGEIVDLGPLLGVGTNALARGLAQNTRAIRKQKRIHSFDLFLAKGMGDVITETAKSGSVLDRFLRNNADYLPYLSVSPGNILDLGWDRSPVEILFIDLAKTWELNSFVLRHFFPCLIPGPSVVVQQDYVHCAEYWIPISMEFLADYFELLYFLTGATAVFRCTQEIPAKLIFEDLSRLGLDQKIHYLERARAKAPPSVQEILKASQAYCLVDHGELEEALRLIKTVQRSVPATVPTEDFNFLIGPNAKIVEDMLRQRLGESASAELGQAPHTLLRAEVDVVLSETEVSSKSSFVGRAVVKNIGHGTWSLTPTTTGTVRLGAHLHDGSRTKTIERDFLRHKIGPESLERVAPGEEVSFEIAFAAPGYGRYVLEFDLVSEMVCWFAENGSTTVKIPIAVW